MAAQSSPKKEKKFPVMTNNYKDVRDATRSRISKQDSKESSPIGVERNEPERKRNNITEDYKCAQVHNRHGNTNVQPASPWLTRKRASPNGEILDFTCYKKKTDGVLLETENTRETSSSTDLITALATKLCRAENTILRLEQRLQASEKTCKRRSLKIAALEEELKNKQHGLSEDPSDPSYAMQQELMYLQAKSSRLEKQVQDMVNFLADYGLIWVGENLDKDSEMDSESSANVSSHELDFTNLLQCIEELNQLSGYGESQVTLTKHGATFKDRETIPLMLYANGLMLFTGPFRPFTDPGTQLFLRDILDGFFPSELQHAYPEGVTFRVTDKHDVHYHYTRTWKPFRCQGYRLGEKQDEMYSAQICNEAYSSKDGAAKSGIEHHGIDDDHGHVSSTRSSLNNSQLCRRKDDSKKYTRLGASSYLPRLNVVPPISPYIVGNDCIASKRMLYPERLKENLSVSKKKYQETQPSVSRRQKKISIRNDLNISSQVTNHSVKLKLKIGTYGATAIDGRSKFIDKQICLCKNNDTYGDPEDSEKCKLHSCTYQTYDDNMIAINSVRYDSEECELFSATNQKNDKTSTAATKADPEDSERNKLRSSTNQKNDKINIPATNCDRDDSVSCKLLYSKDQQVSETKENDAEREKGTTETYSQDQDNIKRPPLTRVSSDDVINISNSLPSADCLIESPNVNSDPELQSSSNLKATDTSVSVNTENSVFTYNLSNNSLLQNNEDQKSSLHHHQPTTSSQQELQNSVRADNSDIKPSYREKDSNNFTDIPLVEEVESDTSVKFNIKLQESTDSLLLTRFSLLKHRLWRYDDSLESPCMSEDLSLNKDNDSQSYSLYEDLRDEAQTMMIGHDKKYRPSKAIRDDEFGMPQSSIATVNKGHSRKRVTSKVNPYGRVSVFGEDILPRPSIETKQRKSILLNPLRNPPTIVDSSFIATENPPSQLDKRKVPEVLREIPVTVLRCGKLVDVNDGVARIFQETAPVIKTIVTSDYLSTVPNKVSLKIRSEDGSEIYFVRMSPDDTVGMLYNLLNQMRSSNGEEDSRDYVILSRCLSIASLPLLDEEMTLRQYNIIHNSVLHLQASTRNS